MKVVIEELEADGLSEMLLIFERLYFAFLCLLATDRVNVSCFESRYHRKFLGERKFYMTHALVTKCGK